MTPTAAAAKKQQRKVARPKATVPTTPQIKVTGVPDRPLPPSVKRAADAGTRIPTMLPVSSVTRAAVPLSYSSDFSTGADHYFDSHAEYCPVETEQVCRELSLWGTVRRPTYLPISWKHLQLLQITKEPFFVIFCFFVDKCDSSLELENH